MVWTTVIITAIFTIWVIGTFYVLVIAKNTDDQKDNPSSIELLKRQAILENQVALLKLQLDKIPTKVLESITSSGNNYKGKLAELIGYMKLNAQYDKVISFGDITDFIGIRFATNTDKGSIDFIDIKNGPHAKLTKDQSKFKKLIEDKRINFVKVRVDTQIPKDSST